MSTQENVLRTNNQSTTNFDTSIIFLWANKFIKANFINSTYDDIELVGGTVMGRIAATEEVVPLDPDATDGSQYPVGILAETITIEEGETVELNLCNAGSVAEEKIVLEDDVTLSSVTEDMTLRDRLAVLGVKLVTGTEMTDNDNQ
jgi:hypothetical protein